MPYTSLPSAAFMLAFAAGEEMVKSGSKRAGLRLPKNNSPLGLGTAELVDRWDSRVPLVARTRVAPSGNSGIARWALLDGGDLQKYLDDATQ